MRRIIQKVGKILLEFTKNLYIIIEVDIVI